MRLPVTIGIRTSIFALCAAVALLCGGILIITAAGVARDITARKSTATLHVLGQEVARQLARSLHVQWRELEGLVRFAQTIQDRDALRQRLETIAHLNERYAWIGVARP
ncbi:hypothetical protein ACLF3G_29130, partial [Falsiroseomonas sp. HC035]|uniref:hypothetical protein n=1 Tax=Falsiroseomonas sp. HC035 TaxID=3390999 RepID=UPI003D313CD3